MSTKSVVVGYTKNILGPRVTRKSSKQVVCHLVAAA
jgi:hypothetical protein